jgi:addiction module HigA family antidote
MSDLSHPGDIVADEIAELNTSPTELAHKLHVPANHIPQPVAGKRAMTADTAMNLQKRYELDLVCEKSDKLLKTIQALPQAIYQLEVQQP